MSKSNHKPNGLPLVKEKTNAQSETIKSILGLIEDQEIIIPDYQRDAEQWDERKKSMFIESLMNNLTIPAFFFSRYENEDEELISEVIDGQQRLTTIRDFCNDEFKLGDSNNIDYLSHPNNINISAHYRGKKFSELARNIKKTIESYPLTIIYLPTVDFNTKLEIFRRINEGGTPLTGQDIRLSYYSQAKNVTFIRLVGIYKESKNSLKMIQSAEKKGIANIWDTYKDRKETWFNWWEGKAKAKGQTPSLMFLWFILYRHRKYLHNVIKNPTDLRIVYKNSIENALDICCYVLQEDEKNLLEAQVFSMKEMKNLFNDFSSSIHIILNKGMPGISVDKYKQLALFIGVITEEKINLKKLDDTQWEMIARFIREPRNTSRDLLNANKSYPEPRSWDGKSGQYQQFEMAKEIVNVILEKKKISI